MQILIALLVVSLLAAPALADTLEHDVISLRGRHLLAIIRSQ